MCNSFNWVMFGRGGDYYYQVIFQAIIRSFFIHLLYMNIALYWKDVTCVRYLIKVEVMLKIVCHPITKKKNTKKVGVDSSTTDF